MYMSDIGRWNGVDALAEMYYSYSTYTYVLNNPIRLIDPDGMSADEHYEGAEAQEAFRKLQNKSVKEADFDEDKPKKGQKEAQKKEQKNITTNGNLDVKQGATDYIEVGTDITATTLEYGAIPMRKSFSLNQRINGNSLRISTLSKMRFGGSFLGNANIAMTAYNTYDDISSYKDGKIPGVPGISGMRLSYKLGSGAVAVGVSSVYGGVAGAIVGTAGVVGEVLYDYLDYYWIQPLATFNTRLETSLKNGWFPAAR